MEKENKKLIQLWSPNTSANWSLLFSVIFGAWIHSKNWEALNEIDKAKKSKIWFFAGIFIFIISIIMEKGAGLNIIFLFLWYFISAREQVRYIKNNHIKYEKKSILKPLGLAFLTLLIYLIFFLSIEMISTNNIKEKNIPVNSQEINVERIENPITKNIPCSGMYNGEYVTNIPYWQYEELSEYEQKIFDLAFDECPIGTNELILATKKKNDALQNQKDDEIMKMANEKIKLEKEKEDTSHISDTVPIKINFENKYNTFFGVIMEYIIITSIQDSLIIDSVEFNKGNCRGKDYKEKKVLNYGQYKKIIIPSGCRIIHTQINTNFGSWIFEK